MSDSQGKTPDYLNTQGVTPAYLNDSPLKPDIDTIFTELIGSGNRKEAKKRLYERLAAEAEHLIFADGIRREALPIDKLKAIMEIKE